MHAGYLIGTCKKIVKKQVVFKIILVCRMLPIILTLLGNVSSENREAELESIVSSCGIPDSPPKNWDL